MAELFSILTFDNIKVTDVLDIPETYTPVAQLVTPLRPAGLYSLGISLTYVFSSITTSAFLRWRTNGGAWNEYQREPKDITDSQTVFYSFPSSYPEQITTVDIEMRKETASGQLDLKFLDCYFQRIGQ
jgi:hypothetical protein